MQSNASIRSNERILDYRSRTHDGWAPNLAPLHRGAVLEYHPADDLASVIDSAPDIPLYPLIKDNPIRLKQIVPFACVKPPTFQNRAVDGPAFVHKSLNGIGDF